MESAKAEDSELLLVRGESSSEARDFGCGCSFTVLLEDMVVMTLTRRLYAYKVSIRAYL